MATATLTTTSPTIPARVVLPDTAEMPRKMWTRTQYRNLVTMGLISEDDRYELIEGEIIPKVPQGRKHAISTSLTQEVLRDIFGRGRTQSQMPIDADAHNEPEPDVAVLRKRVEDYPTEPQPEDILLLVEVSVSTLRMDRTIKTAIYARSGIPEYWVIDVNRRLLYVYRHNATGAYDEPQILAETDTVASLAAPQSTITVADLLPPPAPLEGTILFQSEAV